MTRAAVTDRLPPLPTAAEVAALCGCDDDAGLTVYASLEEALAQVFAEIEEVHARRGPQFDRRIADEQCERLALVAELSGLQVDILDILSTQFRKRLRPLWH
jgi:hypothetical protein